jgi:hypothetical protein
VLKPWEVALLLRAYCRRRCYLVAVAAGGFRFNLDGTIASEVAVEHVAGAKAALGHIDAGAARAAEVAKAERQAERAKRKAEHEAEQAKAAREFVAARRAAREAVRNGLAHGRQGPRLVQQDSGPAQARDSLGQCRDHAAIQGNRLMTMPAFVFIRDRQVEVETGYELAGKLVTSYSKSAEPNQGEVAAVIQELTRRARSGEMPHDAVECCWVGGKPPSATEPTDAEMVAWAKDHIIIEVRVDPPNDEFLCVGETDLRRLDVIPRH